MAEPTTSAAGEPVELPTAAQVADEVETWLVERWDPRRVLRDWWRDVAEQGYCAPGLPTRWGGRGWTRDLEEVVRSAFERAGAPDCPGGIGRLLVAPTLVAAGTDEQCARLLPGILDGTANWCQLFSEPGAGSDLAGLSTRATPDGDGWRVTGQKVWTSHGHLADWGILLARTGEAPRHRGLTMFAIDMRQPQIDVRPIREMTGRQLFNEVFLEDAWVDADNIIGEREDGWRVANILLGFERSMFTGSSLFSAAIPGRLSGDLDRPAGDFSGARDPHAVGKISAARFRDIVDMARRQDRASCPLARQQLARLWSLVELSRIGVLRHRTGISLTGAEPNLSKLLANRALRIARDLVADLEGPASCLLAPDAAGDALASELILFSPAPSIYGGSDEIQRNVIAERTLGLPREPRSAREDATA